jgi:hypothetical protein
VVFEHRTEPLLSRRLFVRRVVQYALTAGTLIAGALALGVIGYHVTERLSWLDALLNASMILGGMGPVDPIRTTAGKLFASFYSLFSGVLFLAAVSVLIAPVAHRMLHRLHLEARDGG